MFLTEKQFFFGPKTLVDALCSLFLNGKNVHLRVRGRLMENALNFSHLFIEHFPIVAHLLGIRPALIVLSHSLLACHQYGSS